ncbi:hypothetical protein FACS189491_03770 [Spirochaetia bacterium]|nr:hypothetical protein FACS189491_03770 [Spirochaetia bacterium]
MILLSLWAPSLGAEEPPDPASAVVVVQTSPEFPRIGQPWTLSFLVDHPVPEEVRIDPPPLPAALFVEEIRIEPRLIQKPAGDASIEGASAEDASITAVQAITERWTVVEYRFVLHGSGRIVLAPFEVTIPGAVIPTTSITLIVPAGYTPRLNWQNPPAVLRTGESAELILTLSGWDPRRALPESRLFLPKTPPETILEQASIAAEDREQGMILRLIVIPLGGEVFALPQTPVILGEFSLNVPAIRIPVTAAAVSSAAAPPAPAGYSATISSAAISGAAVSTITAPVTAAAIPFPATQAGVFPPFRSACNDIRERAEALWNEGRRAEALAELRQNERDHAAGPSLIPLRREAERVLGLEAQGDEKWRPSLLLGAGLLLSLGLLILSGVIRLFRKKNAVNAPCAVTPGWSRGYKCILITLFIVMGISLYGLGDAARRLLPGSAQYALVRETEARRVPEAGGVVNAHFKEGERVLSRGDKSPGDTSLSDWAYAESETGAGWVRIKDIIFY